MSQPTFVIVGHVNRGKSSIVSTLAADESVRIGPEVGTTRHCRTYPMRINDRTLYELIDTPGFERPRQVLQWLREHETSTAQRPDVVRRFVEEHARDPAFACECRLLAPVLAGAAVLYVVDGSVPFAPAYEAEMEILRWTGRPRMALINRIGQDDYIDQWRPILDQYFNLVHEFDAHRAGFVDRLRLIRALREIHQPWQPALDRALEALSVQRQHDAHDAAGEIAAMLAAMLTLVREKRLSADADPAAHRQALVDAYYAELRRLEARTRDAVGQIYRREQFQVRESELAATQDDLFSRDVWLRFGLSRGRLAAGGAAAGAVSGGTIDALVGGASFGFGAALGGLLGAGAGYFGAGKLPRARIMNLPLGGTRLRVGPMLNRNFPWIVLGRALTHHRLVAGAAHARRGLVDASAPDPDAGRPTTDDFHRVVAADLPDHERKPIEKCFDRLRKRPDETTRAEIEHELTTHIERLLEDGR